MSNLQAGNYHIILKSRGLISMGLGLKTDNGANYWCAVTQWPVMIWALKPIAGTDGFYLSANQGPQPVLSPHFGGADGQRINLGTLDMWSKEYVLRADDVGDGWVAINNHDRTRVFDAAGDKPSVGVNVICYKWNGGDNQRWKFIPA